MVDTNRDGQISRRTVLKGMAGAASLMAIPPIVAACSPAATTAPTVAPSAAASTAPTVAPSVEVGSVRFAATWSGDTDALKAVAEKFTAETGIAVKFNTPDPQTFSDQINSYLQGTPDDVLTWYAGYRMRFYADQGLLTDISDVWSKIGASYSDAFKASSTGNDGKQYLIPFYNYPWVVIYRKSLFAEKGYTIPKTLAEFKALADKMKADGLVPLSFADKDGWPAQGHFDIFNLRVNGYDYHVGLMAGKEKWTDPRTAAAFTAWKDLLPYYAETTGALGRTWQEGINAVLDKTAAMYFFGTFAGTQATDPVVHDDLDFFPFPTLGTAYDSEMGIDAPINGFLMTAKSQTLQEDMDAAKAWLEFLASGTAQASFLAANPNFVACAKDADTAKYVAFQTRMAEIIGSSGAIAQFLDRDTDPAFATQMQGFLQTWLSDPEQDINAFLKTIQDFWDSLGIS